MISEPNQFYALSPGQNPLRPERATPVAGLTLAGGYTKQPWIDTMEDATVWVVRPPKPYCAAAGRSCLDDGARRSDGSEGPR